MVQTQMATSTEVEGMTTVDVPPEMEMEMELDPIEDEGEKQTPEEDVQPEETQEVQPSPETDLSPREERRVQKLIPKLKSETERANKAESALKELLQKSNPNTIQEGLQQPSFVPPWEQPQPMFQPNEQGEVSENDLQRAVIQTADQLTTVKLVEFKRDLARYEGLREDIAYVEKQYAPSAEDQKTISELYETARKGNPDLRFKSFAEPILKRIQAGQETGKAQITPKLIRQEAEGAVPPSGGSTKSNSSSQPETLEEMEAYLKANNLWDEA